MKRLIGLTILLITLMSGFVFAEEQAVTNPSNPPAINEAGKGLLYGNPGQLVTQLIAVVVTMIYSGVVTLIIFMLVKAFVGIRVDAEHEITGLDESQHGEKAYNL